MRFAVLSGDAALDRLISPHRRGDKAGMPDATEGKPPRFCLSCRSSDCPHLSRHPSHLSARELQFLRLLTDPHHSGLKHIAYALGMKEGTLKVYVTRLYDKLRWKDRSLRLLTLWVVLHAEELGATLPTAAQFGEVAGGLVAELPPA